MIYVRPMLIGRLAILSLRGVFYAFGALLLALALLTVITARPADRSLYPPAAAAETVTVYVKYSWLHANIVLPTDRLQQHSGTTIEAMTSAQMPLEAWTALGWGDLWYYRERGKTSRRYRDFARSMLHPDNPAVIFIEPLAEAPTPETTGRDVIRLELSEEGFARLAARLDSSFLLEDGAPVIRGRGRGRESWFFASHEGSDLTQVCNHWIGHLLSAAGVPVTPVTDSVTDALSLSLQWRAGARKVPGDPSAYQPLPETPPAHSGLYDALSPSARAVSATARFETYTIELGPAYTYETAPLRLREAGPDLAALMGVPPESLIEIRRVTAARRAGEGLRLCGETPARFLITGFREKEDTPYELVLAAYRGEDAPGADLPEGALCGVYHYRQR